jgi:hypothetical protein
MVWRRSIRFAHADLDHFFSLSLDMRAVVGPDTCFKRVNPAFGDALGAPVAELLLRRAGHQTLAAANGAQAIRMLRESEHTIQLVLLDLVTPGLRGPETWEQMRRPYPHVDDQAALQADGPG